MNNLEQHSALISIIIFIMSIIGFFIKQKFFKKNKNENNNYIKTGGSISAGGDIIVGNKTIPNIKDNTSTNNLNKFIEFIENSKWKKEFIDNKEIWICEDDNTYQIQIGERDKQFSEPWTEAYPDSKGSWKTSVYLTINGIRIKELTFIYMDGCRIFVPITEIENDNEKIKYYWDKNSLGFKVSNIIGEYHVYKSINGIAEISKILIK